jgi:hypothetical protein
VPWLISQWQIAHYRNRGSAQPLRITVLVQMANSMKIVWKTKKFCHHSSPQLTNWILMKGASAPWSRAPKFTVQLPLPRARGNGCADAAAGEHWWRHRPGKPLFTSDVDVPAIWALTLLTVVTGQRKLCGPYALDSVYEENTWSSWPGAFSLFPFPSKPLVTKPLSIGWKDALTHEKRCRKKIMQDLNGLIVEFI